MSYLYEKLKFELIDSTAQDVVAKVMTTFGKRVVFASSLGLEDQVITHMALQFSQSLSQKCRIFVLETGCLHKETIDVIEKMQQKYQMTYEIMYPNVTDVDSFVSKKGKFSFYESIENRKLCCHIRKVEPLRRVLNTADAWVTGQRQSQSITRSNLQTVEWDEENQKIKFNPLVHWTIEQVWDYIKSNQIPYNVLHDCGYPSIGCDPCTRAIKPGEDARAGRWWWESADKKECGLHQLK